MSLPYHAQERSWTCGAAAARMALESCGITRSEKQVIALLGTNHVRGTWARNFPQFFERFKCDYAVHRNASLDDVEDALRKGYVVLSAYYVPRERVDHYIVIKKLDDTHVWFNDPFYGPDHRHKRSYFKRVWRTDPRYDNERCWFVSVRRSSS